MQSLIKQIEDYVKHKRIACYWARIALENKAHDLPYQDAAKNAHDNLRLALLIIS